MYVQYDDLTFPAAAYCSYCSASANEQRGRRFFTFLDICWSMGQQIRAAFEVEAVSSLLLSVGVECSLSLAEMYSIF